MFFSSKMIIGFCTKICINIYVEPLFSFFGFSVWIWVEIMFPREDRGYHHQSLNGVRLKLVRFIMLKLYQLKFSNTLTKWWCFSQGPHTNSLQLRYSTTLCPRYTGKSMAKTYTYLTCQIKNNLNQIVYKFS